MAINCHLSQTYALYITGGRRRRKQSAMADSRRYALVTGANKGIGFEICRQLASKGTVVVLASRDEKRGTEARERLLKESNVSDDNSNYYNVIFHQLDVTDAASVAAVADFIATKFGRLDILVNNAGINGVCVEGDVSVFQDYVEADYSLAVADAGRKVESEAEAVHPKAKGRVIETFEGAKDCIETNYYGTKRVTQALIPLLQKSNSPRIVNVSSSFSSLLLQPNEWARGVFSSEDSSEEKVEQVLHEFLKDCSDAKLQEKHWPPRFSAYKVSKAALNACTRIIAKKHQSFCINCVCPGFTKTDITYNFGPLSEAEAAEAPVKLALLPDGGPSGCFFTRDQALSLC